MHATIETTASRGGKILFVDDEALSLKYFKAAVGKYADVVTAENPEAAMKILAAEGDAISVVVSDERMPRESGVAFLASVRKSWPSTVRILTSAYTNVDLQEAINSAAISRFVPKPWNFDELCNVLKEALQSEHAAEATHDFDEAPAANPANPDAQNATLELLAVLSRELTEPLAEIDAESLRLASLAGADTAINPSPVQSLSANWARRLHAGQIGTSAARIHTLVEHCRALAKPIVDLAEGLAVGVSPSAHSMANALSEASEQITRKSGGRIRMTIDARNDFSYCAPKKIVEFVLIEQLEFSHASTENGACDVSVKLVPGATYNDVVITVPGHSVRNSPESLRMSRCALWAFGGEVLLQEADDKAVTKLRFPAATVTLRHARKH
ncbi:response regulator [Hyphomicrobium methylovorum]|uniref:response regulator n=1 Tax=Hyphomicrobium methylovorum TaxID=84 RepID=UPI0015E7D509|nr:response regulator [Hyphomicrobium methylovorum]MBA2127670.1 response regulator [Hyphomicrobium methylovorum]